MISRRSFLCGLRETPAPNPQRELREGEPAASIPANIAEKSASFRTAMHARARGSGDGPKLAVLSPFLCLLRLGTECSVCAERCPVPGAIRIEHRSVTIDPKRCDGCGVCVERCPAPIGALALRPIS